MTPVLHLINQETRDPWVAKLFSFRSESKYPEVNSIKWKPNFSLIAQASASMKGHKAVWKVIGSQIKEM